ncbi:MAG: serine/threonine-protein kinase, partial [Acidobacteriota bacterium]
MSVAGDRVGTIVLQRRLGVGGMGEVWAGHDERLDRKVAVKILRDELLDAESRLRLRREARMLSRLEHPGVCRLYDLIEDEGASALVLELVEGRSLREVLDDDDPPRRERLRLALDVADALVAAHLAGMVHRDLKLNNIRVRPDGRAVLLDFGLARPTDARPIATRPLERSMLEDPGLSRLGATPGTVGNMSPEQARGEEVTPASDVYAFGLLLHELLGRVAPYPPGLGVEELRIKAVEGDLRPLEGVDRATVELIRSLERGEPAERPSMLEVRQRLQALAERPARRRRRLIAAAVAIGVLVGGAKVASDLERERRAALAAKSVADSAREEAVERRREAEQTVAFLESLFEGSDPAAARGRETSARELLERGAERIHADLADQPLVSARLLRTIGRVSQSLGDFERAERLIAESIALRRTHRP